MREANTAFNQNKACVNIFGYEFSCNRVIDSKEVVQNPDEAIKRLQELSFNAPVIIRDEIKFRKMLLGLPTLIIYCDPMIHGRDVYNKILASVSEAR